MIGFVNTVNGFSLSAIQALQVEANILYSYWRREQPLPDTPYDVTDYGLVGDGFTDNTAALTALASNQAVTNWYFPEGVYRLLGINVPEQVKAVYGVGTLQCIAQDTTSPIGVIRQTANHTGYVIDGLTFIDTTESFPSNETGQYGIIHFSGRFSQKDIEVRNCTIDGSNSTIFTAGSYPRSMNGITVWTETGSLVHNLWIHDNIITDIAGAGIEMLHRGDIDVDGSEQRLYNQRISNNTITGRGPTLDSAYRESWCGISFSQQRSIATVDNNTMTGWRWDMELNQAQNITVKNNKCTGTVAEFISIGGGGWHTPEYDDINAPNINWVHNNHFESDGAFIMAYANTSTQIYHNFIKGGLFQNGGRCGDVYENTFVKNLPDAVSGYTYSLARIGLATQLGGAGATSPVMNINFRDNEIYTTDSYANAYGILIDNEADSTVRVTGNNVYMESSNDCVYTESGGTPTISDGTCTINYTGTIPTSRTGAGLL